MSIHPDILAAGGTTRLYTSVISLRVSPIYLDSQLVKRDTEIPIEKRKTFVLLSIIGLETNTYPMNHKNLIRCRVLYTDTWHFILFPSTMNFDF